MEAQIAIDFEGSNAMGGVFRQVKGNAEIVWPATEHAFVLEGKVEIYYHEQDKTVEYNPGDGWVIGKGERVTWRVKSPTFMKSFFLLREE